MNNQTVFVGIDPVAIGNRIATLRESSGYTVSELIEKVGLKSEMSFYKWRKGESVPTVDNLLVLSVIFNTSIDYLVKGENELTEEGENPLPLGFL